MQLLSRPILPTSKNPPRGSLARICEVLSRDWDTSNPADYAPGCGWQANTRKSED